MCSFTVSAESSDAFSWNAKLGRGINLGNFLESKRGKTWMGEPKAEYFDLMQQAGFDSVRIPVRWSAYTAAEAPYRIEPDFLKRVDGVIDEVLSRGMLAVVNVHHFEEFMHAPETEKPRLLAIWKQLSEHYQDYPPELFFETLNEPVDNVSPEFWNACQNEIIAVIRQSNPKRMIQVSSLGWNRIDKLPLLELPPDPYLIASVHFYDPHPFTHQGASWVDYDPPVGRKFPQSDKEKLQIKRNLDQAAAWSKEHGIPINVGEFGAFSKADMDSRIRWTRFVREEFEQRGFSWNYWEFGSSFGIYDARKGEWRLGLVAALLGKESAQALQRR